MDLKEQHLDLLADAFFDCLEIENSEFGGRQARR